MIISASYRTDIPAFHGAWFHHRLEAGWVEVRNPYGGPPSRVSLRPEDVDGYVFWTRNARPFLPGLERVAAQGRPFLVQYTLTALPEALDGASPPPDQALEVMAAIARTHGPDCLVWRYDPILLTTRTDTAWHLAHFARLADRVVAATGIDEVVVSLFQPYRKATRRLDKVPDLGWWDPPAEEKRALLSQLAALARDRGLRLSLCAQPDLLPGDGSVAEAACLDTARLSRVAGQPLTAARKPHRATCACAQSRDIGAYDTCAHGCLYCYAVNGQDRAKTLVAKQNAEASRLGP